MIMLFITIGTGYFITSDLPPPRCAPVVVEPSTSPDLNALLHDRSRVCWQVAAPAAETAD